MRLLLCLVFCQGVPAHVEPQYQDSPQDATKATGSKKVLVARVDFLDSQSADTAWLTDSVAQDWLGGNSDPKSQANAAIQRASFGRLRLDNPTIAAGITRMPKAITQYSNCPELYEGLISGANGFDPATFDLVIILWESSSSHFGFAGQGFSGTPMILAINGISNYNGEYCHQCIFGLMIHEISHCFGASYHPRAWVASAANVAPASISYGDVQICPHQTSRTHNPAVSACAVEQGDPFEPLSWPSVSSRSQAMAPVKWQYSWIRTSEVHVAKGDHGFGERVRLNAHDAGMDSLTGGAKLAIAALSQSAPESESIYVWVEYKANYANYFENDDFYTSAEQIALRRRGAMIHLASGPGAASISVPILLDADISTTQGNAGSWPKGLADAPLQIGRSFEASPHGVVVTVLGNSCGEAVPWLEVMVSKKQGGNAAPAISDIAASSAMICAGKTVDISCLASDAETEESLLAYEWDMGDGLAPWNSDSVRTRTWTFEEKGTFAVTCTVQDGSGNSATKTKNILVSGPDTFKQDKESSDGANSCSYSGQHSVVCAFISDNKYDYQLIYLNGKGTKEGWFGSMDWMNGFDSAAFSFDAVSIPKDTDVELAELAFTVNSAVTGSVGTVDIKVELSDNALGLVDGLTVPWCTNCLTTARTWTESVTWTIAGDLAAGDILTTVNFGPLVKELVAIPTWPGTGRLVVSIVPKAGDGFVAVRKDANLKIRWQTLPAEGADNCPKLDFTKEGSVKSGSDDCGARAPTPAALAPTAPTPPGLAPTAPTPAALAPTAPAPASATANATRDVTTPAPGLASRTTASRARRAFSFFFVAGVVCSFLVNQR